jgi:hypothetical protein
MKRALAILFFLLFQLVIFSRNAHSQSKPQGTDALPNVDTLLQAAAEKQNVFAFKRQQYTCVMKSLDQASNTSRLYESFYIHGREIKRLFAINDEPLDPFRKEQEEARVKEEIRASQQMPLPSFAAMAGGWSFAEGNHPWSETVEGAILRMSSFSEETLILYKERLAIRLEFHGNSRSKANTPVERAARVFAGQIIVDQTDGAIVHIEGEAKSDVKDDTSVLVGRGYKLNYDAVKIAEGLYVPSAWSTAEYVFAADPKADPPYYAETHSYWLQSCRVNE